MKKTIKKISFIQCLLTIFYVVSLLISNIIASKQFLLPFDLIMTSAVIVFPITYILSDLFSEVYGYDWSRHTSYIAFAMNLFMSAIFIIVIKLPHPIFWENQSAIEAILGNTPRILFSSLFAFLAGDFVNDIIFKKMKEKHQNTIEGFSRRAIVSSIFGQLIDSLIFIPLAFIGTMPIKLLALMIFLQVLFKLIYEIIILPLNKLIVSKVAKYESSNK